ncbi:MAG: DNA polymerase III subunit beta [Candidatus Veblenbacteria bacterium]|nr:DNA polymerase III subunit beta [Candidatus Veblenbacteria bacterium]
MKFLCTQENLNSGLALVGHVASKSTSLPILNNILLRTTQGGLELVATNLEVAITTMVRGKTEGEGTVTVQGRLFSEAVALLPHDKVELVVEGTTLTLICGRSRTVVRGMSADDFPVIPQVSGGTKFSLPADELGQAIASVAFTVNPEEGRPEISGVFLGNTEKHLVLVGTDSYRLAERTLSQSVTLPQSEGMIVPLRAAQEVGRVTQGAEGQEVIVVLGDNQVLWQIGDTQIVSRLVAGQYPDYRQIVPKEFSATVVVSREALAQAVRSASLFVRSGINDVRFSFETNAKAVKISSTNSQLGENTTELEATVEGEAAEVVFNYRYLLDGLQTINTKEVQVKVAGPNNPSLFEPKGETGYRYLIMPIRQ